jgi:hypothetical protein
LALWRTSQLRQERWTASNLRSSRDVSNSYRKTSVSLLTVEGLRNKHWRPPTPPHSVAVRQVLFLLGPPS